MSGLRWTSIVHVLIGVYGRTLVSAFLTNRLCFSHRHEMLHSPRLECGTSRIAKPRLEPREEDGK
jgi:hypothetical protein